MGGGFIWRDVTYPLLSRFGNIPVGFKKGANVDGLAAPEMSMNSPVKCKLQGAPVEGAVGEEAPISDPRLAIHDQRPATESQRVALDFGYRAVHGIWVHGVRRMKDEYGGRTVLTGQLAGTTWWARQTCCGRAG